MNTTRSKVRVTVPVSQEVQDTFKRLADASGVSVGKSMGDWLQDTLDAAILMANLLEKAREQPKLALRELHSYTLGISDVTQELLAGISRASEQVSPPVSNTGGKPTLKPKKVRGPNAKNKD